MYAKGRDIASWILLKTEPNPSMECWQMRLASPNPCCIYSQVSYLLLILSQK